MTNTITMEGVELTNLDGEGDHVHILFQAQPTTVLVKFINTVKGATVAASATSTRRTSKPCCGARHSGTAPTVSSRRDRSRWTC